MFLRALVLSLLSVFAFSTPAAADLDAQRIGGDLYLAGGGTSGQVDANRDVFIAGGSVTLQGRVSGDTHAAGFDVDVEAETSGNLYAFGASVTLYGPVRADLTVAGGSVRTARDAETSGNARLTGGSLTIEGPVRGTLSASGGEIYVNAPIDGDAWLVGGDLSFGPDARVSGMLRYAGPEEVEIPASVAAPERIRFERLTRMERYEEWGRGFTDRDFSMWPTAASIFAGFIVTLAFFIIVAAIFLATMPKRVEAVRAAALNRPGLSMIMGALGLATAFGMVPVSAMTIVGIPLIPFVILALIILWTLGYLLGAYVMSLRLWHGLGGTRDLSVVAQLGVLAGGIFVIAILNFIPVLGWLANFALVLFGIGAIVVETAARAVGQPSLSSDRPVDISGDS